VETKGNKEPNQKKGENTIKMLSQKAKRGREKNLTKRQQKRRN
jgi:hypothetical protein